ncbi:MAG TPA: hypothetical protein PK406_13695 [Verrucomicrobiota bacterium]|nr:hypothetical protein [Verrucomicrobiota bacterium]
MSTPRDPAALTATLEALLGAIRLRFYRHRPADYQRDRRRLLHAVTWPATWLEERGLTCAPPRYHTLIEERLQAIAAHGNPAAYGAYFPAYLLKCLQDWFDRHGDELYSELKHIRNALDQLLASACFAERVQQHARQLDLLVSTHRLLARRPSGPQHHATDQLTLF